MRKIVAALILAMVLFMAPMAGSASAEPAPVVYDVYQCGAISWSYSEQAKFGLRDEWINSINRVSAVSGLHFVEAEPGTDADINVKWKTLGKMTLGRTGSYTTMLPQETIVFSNMVLSNRYPRYVKNNYSPNRFSTRIEYLMVHELGHAIGLGHSKDSRDLMAADDTVSSPRLTANDVVAFQSVRPFCGDNVAY